MGGEGSVTRLDAFIQDRQINAEELARLSSVSDAYLSRLRLGKSKPTRPIASRIARACSWIACQKVNAWELFDETA